MGGDEEDDAGIDKYSSYSAAKDSRLFHVGTAAGSYVKNRNASLARTVIVLDATGLTPTLSEKEAGKSYDLSGRPATKNSKLIIRNGKKTLHK